MTKIKEPNVQVFHYVDSETKLDTTKAVIKFGKNPWSPKPIVVLCTRRPEDANDTQSAAIIATAKAKR